MDMMATGIPDTTTVSRNVLTPCTTDSVVTVMLMNGVVTSGSTAQSLASLTGFQYVPSQTNGQSAAWSYYSNSAWNAQGSSLDPLPISIQLIDPINVG